jgi:Domain of unknown function (DUF1772)
MTTILTIAVLITSGLLAGGMVLVAAALVPTFRMLPTPASVQLHQTIDRYINRYITPDTAFTIVLSVLLVALSDGTTERVLVGIGGLLCVVVTLISVRSNVPINKAIGRWQLDALPADARGVHRKWARSHIARTVAGVLALLSFAAAAVSI